MKNYTNINIGCGDRLTKGYLNFNSSLSVRLSKLPYFIIELIYLLNLIAVQHYNYIKLLKKTSFYIVTPELKYHFQMKVLIIFILATHLSILTLKKLILF